ncbi:hypothetical protein EV363DRAFT_1151216 [Boletus edulis]|uniref:EngB-type G domain-containing protein n=1 Tax=Boletus edulis BED1 TaxID=1328754 RepID=A0AAD4C6T6_BOLED|nr:hypothetical protein EV363DRAFT_1151216 [Boletus edulis]KAF8449269.1 hypothetical protein L210DRAFT_3609623 [Boletus edulis BED1]
MSWLPSRRCTNRIASLVNRHCPLSRKSSTSSKTIFQAPGSADFLASATDVNSFPRFNRLPESSCSVDKHILPGRANVGKSTLLNAVLGRKDLLFTSKRAGRTQALNFFRVGPHPGKLVVVDSPGYGSRGRSEWGAVFNHYVTNREELRRIYIIFSAPHGLRSTDEAMLAKLDTQVQQLGGTKFSLQAIITKADQLGDSGREHVDQMKNTIFKAAPTCLSPIITACPPKGSNFGIELIRKSITDCCGL